MSPPLTLIEKIATRYAVGLTPAQVVRSGDFVTIRPKHVMTHDNTGAVIPKFKQIGGAGARIHDPHQPVFAIDHDIGGVPLIVIYLFGVWIALVACAAWLARRLGASA